MEMKIQVALDFGTIEDAKKILEDVIEYVDIVEVGAISTEFGFRALQELKESYPGAEYLSDIKIADGGGYFTKMASDYGADYVTILGAVEDATIESALREADKCGIKLVADMLGVRNFYERVKELDQMGVHYLSVHTPADLQALNHTPFEHLKIASQLVRKSKLSVAGGIGPKNVMEVLPYEPDIIISGSALTDPDADRKESAKILREIVENYKQNK